MTSETLPSPLDGLDWEDHAELSFARVLKLASESETNERRRIAFEWEQTALWARLPQPFEERRWGGQFVRELPREAWEHLIARSRSATQASLRALYGHLVFEFRQVHRLRLLPAEVGAADIASIAEVRGLRFERLHVADALGRAAELAIQIKDDGLLRESLGRMLVEASAGLDASDPGLIIHMLKHFPPVFLRKKGLASEYRPWVERGLRAVANMQAAGHWPEQAFGYLVELAADSGSQKAARLERAQYILRIAEAADVPGERLRALHFFQDAIAEFSALGERELAGRAAEASRRCAAAYEPEMKRISTEATIDTSGVRRFIEHLMSLPSWKERLFVCAHLRDVVPSQDQVADSARATLQNSALYAMSREVLLVGGRAQEPPQEDRFQLQCRRMTKMNIEIGCNVVWARVLAALRQAGLDAGSLVAALRESELLPGADWEVIAHGFDRIFTGDRISGVHVLVPHLERVLRERARQAGVSATVFSDTHGRHLRERTLGSLLREVDITKAFDADLRSFFSVVLEDEDAGFNLRNRVAHGLVNASDVTASISGLVVFCYVALLRAPPKAAESVVPPEGAHSSEDRFRD